MVPCVELADGSVAPIDQDLAVLGKLKADDERFGAPSHVRASWRQGRFGVVGNGRFVEKLHAEVQVAGPRDASPVTGEVRQFQVVFVQQLLHGALHVGIRVERASSAVVPVDDDRIFVVEAEVDDLLVEMPLHCALLRSAGQCENRFRSSLQGTNCRQVRACAALPML